MCTNSVCGYVNEIWIKKNKKVVELVYVSYSQEKEELANRKEENKIKKENKQYVRHRNAKNIKKYGKLHYYAKLKEKMFWIENDR